MQSYRSTNAPSKEPCTFFARNACKSGDFCRFAHVITSQSSTALCQFFLRGSCNYGDQCFNLHLKESQGQSTSQAPIVCKFYIQGECRNGSSCPYRHDKGSLALLSRVSPRPRSANNLDTPPQQLSPLRNLKVLHPLTPTYHSGYSSDASLRSLPVQAHDTDDPDHFGTDDAQETATGAEIRDKSSGETSDNSLADAVRSPDEFVNPEPTEIVSGDENHATANGHWETMDNVPVDHESPETATGDESRDISSDNRNWETVPDQVPDPPMDASLQREWIEEKAEESNREEVPLPQTTHILPHLAPPVMYAPAYYDPNLFTPSSSHNMILPHNQYHHGYPAPTPSFPHFSPAPVPTTSFQPRASMAFNNAEPCQQHFTYGHCPIGATCVFRHYLTAEELRSLNFNRRRTSSSSNEGAQAHKWKKDPTVPSINFQEEVSAETSSSNKSDYGWGTGNVDTKWDIVEEDSKDSKGDVVEDDSKDTTTGDSWGDSWGATTSTEADLAGWGITTASANPDDTEGWTTTGTDANRARDHSRQQESNDTPSSKFKSESNRGWKRNNNNGGRRTRFGRDDPPHQNRRGGGRSNNNDRTDRTSGWENDRSSPRESSWENDRTRYSKPSPTIKAPSSPRAIVEALSADTSRWLSPGESSTSSVAIASASQRGFSENVQTSSDSNEPRSLDLNPDYTNKNDVDIWTNSEERQEQDAEGNMDSPPEDNPFDEEVTKEYGAEVEEEQDPYGETIDAPEDAEKTTIDSLEATGQSSAEVYDGQEMAGDEAEAADNQPYMDCNTAGIEEGGQDSFEEQVVTTEESLDPPVALMRQSFYCSVKYEQTAQPAQILTAFESDAVRLDNIPLSFGEDDIASMMARFGSILETQTEFPEDHTYCATVTFSSQVDAQEAVKHLHNSDLGDTILQAHLNSKAPIMYDWHPSVPGASVKLSYPTPSRSAWVAFESMELYKKALLLDGELFKGRKLKVSKTLRPPKTRRYYNLRVEGLPLSTLKQEIKDIFKDCMLVEMVSPTYTSSPVNELRALLYEHGELEELDMLPSTDKDTHAVGLARFSSAAAASRAVEDLHNTPQKFIGDGRLKLQSTYCASYHLTQIIHSVVRTDLDDLYKSLPAGLKVYESTSDDSVILRLCGPDVVAFTNTRRDLDRLARGEVILMDEKPLWDDYFDLPSSTRAIDRLNSKSQGVFFIERDFRSRHVLAYGQKERAEESLRKLLNKVWEQVVTMDVSDACIAKMIHAGYPDEVAASNKVQFDFRCRSITVRGDADDCEKVWAAISHHEEEAESSLLAAGERTCALCLAVPSDPIPLPCNHEYCRGCIQLWIKSLIGPNFTSLECIAAVGSIPNGSEKGEISRCCTQVPYTVIHKVLSDEEENDLLEHSFLSHIWANPLEYKLCPTHNCPMVYRVGTPGIVIQCPGCRKEICTSCHVELHEGLTCAEYKSL